MLSKINKLIPGCALIAFTIMILACSSSQEALINVAGPGGGNETEASDHALVTDSLPSAMPDDIAML